MTRQTNKYPPPRNNAERRKSFRYVRSGFGLRPTSDRSTDESSQHDRPGQDRQPVAESGIEARPRVDRDGPVNDRGHFLRTRPRLARQSHNSAIRVDDRGDAHVHGPYDASPRLNRPESRNGEVLLVLRSSVEPAVV